MVIRSRASSEIFQEIRSAGFFAEDITESVVDFSKFRGKPVLVLTGTNDLGHARAVDEPIADWLNANGAEADFIYLSDLGITGNGHILMLERNSDALAQLIIDWIES